MVEELTRRGHSIFLDLKFHDIPNTVAGAVRSAAGLGARMMTVHALGGPAMLEGCLRCAGRRTVDPPTLLAVTVLDQHGCCPVGSRRIGLELPAGGPRGADSRAWGWQPECAGFVCSPQEVGALRAQAGPETTLVIPGIRPAGAAVDDQKRIATPAEALRQGASYLVVGRPITQGGGTPAAGGGADPGRDR